LKNQYIRQLEKDLARNRGFRQFAHITDPADSLWSRRDLFLGYPLINTA